MAQSVYATASDYYDFLGDDDPNEDADGDPIPSPVADRKLDALLRRAANQVDSHIRGAVYETDEDGYPTEQHIADALRDATCAYAAYWDDTDDISGGAAIAGPVKIGSVAIGGTATGGASSRSATDTRISDEAIIILRNAGLLSTVVSYS